MKTYDQLTKVEKDKLIVFATMKEMWLLKSCIILIIPYMAVIVGIALLFVPFLWLEMAGGLIIGLGGVVAIIVFYYLEEDNKKLQLIFGINDFGQFFDFSKADLKSVKKVMIQKYEIRK